jgi:hypothetical protein
MRSPIAIGVGCLGAIAVAALPARGQIPGLPTLQSPFAAPQIAAAVNLGRAEDVTVAGIAGAWTPASARIQLSAGAARVSLDPEGVGYAAGARAYVPIRTFRGGAVAVGALAGAGAERVDEVTVYSAPVGASVGYRRALGATRAFAVYAVPFYSYTGVRTPDASTFLFRYALGADFALLPRVGVTLGLEGGQAPEVGEPGIRGRTLGAGVSYAFGSAGRAPDRGGRR